MNPLYWLIPWEPSPTVVAIILASAVLYARGCRRHPVPGVRKFAFWLGLGLMYVCLHTRVDYYSEHQFFVHRLQHLVLHHLAPFLIVLSYPGTTVRAGLPLSWRVHGLRPFFANTLVRRTLAVLLNPAMASLLFVGLIFFFLWPPMHFDAMIDARLYRVMNWSMAVDGVVFWWLILDRRASPPARLAPGMRIFVPLLIMFPQILLGAYITFTSHELYPIYSLCGRAFAWLSPATDQQVGGLITWIPGSMMSVGAALIALRRWMVLDALRYRRTLRQQERALPPIAAVPAVATDG